MPTAITPVRLSDADRAKINDIKTRFGLPSVAAAIRYAIETVHREIGPPAIPRKKSRKGA